MNYSFLTEPRRFYKYSMEEYDRQEMQNNIFVKYMEDYNHFLDENPLGVQASEVKAYPFWRIYGSDKSAVYNTWFEGNTLFAEFGDQKDRYLFNSSDNSVKVIESYTEKEALCGSAGEKICSACRGKEF